MSCGSSKSGSDTHRRLKTLQSNFRALKIKKTGNRYNESHCKQQVQEIFEGLKYLTTSETDIVFDFEVISKEDLRNLNNCRDRNAKLQTELDNEKEEKENKIARYRREKESIQQKFNEQEMKAVKLEKEVKGLKETIQHEKQKVIKGEEEKSNLRLQVSKFKEVQKDLENENEKLRETIQHEKHKVKQGEMEIASLRVQVKKLEEHQKVLEKGKMQTKIAENEETEKLLGMECLRLQETLNRVRHQGEEAVRNLKVHVEKLEENRKDLENTLRRDLAFDGAAPRRKHRLFVASIDFGTTYSGYAFSSENEWKGDPLKIQTNKWNSSNLMSAKTPTTLLLSPQREFLAFGYDAETKYSESKEDFDSNYYFHCFKLILQGNDKLNCDTLIRDATGKTLDAMTVFSISIKYITDHLFKSLSDKFLEIKMDDIHFVLTVPAIWNDKAKQFMTEAAVRAGIPNEQLSIAMEQEAASIYCREDYLSQDVNRASNLKEGMNVMVVDLGGGTTDITFYRSLENGKFEEIRPPTGGPWGGRNVNEAFFNFIEELFGQSVIDELRKKHMDDYLDLERNFEIKKRSIGSMKTGSVKINFPMCVFQLANEMNKTKSVCDIITKNAKYAGKIKAEAQKLQIPTEILVSLFHPTIGKIIEHIKTILKGKTNEVDVIIMVGGFAECDIVQNEFKKNFTDKKIIVPEEAGLAIMKGAVMYGHMQ